MSEILKFDTTEVREVPVEIDGVEYVLREASGKAATSYRNLMLQCVTLGETGKARTIRGLGDAEPFLVSMCLFRVENNKPVPKTLIESWPARIQKKLYEIAKDISDLEEETEETEGNVDSDTSNS